MRRTYRALLAHRWLALAALLAVTVAFGRLLVAPDRLLVDFSLDALLVPDAVARDDLRNLHEDFGDDLGLTAILVRLPPNHDVSTPDTVAHIDALADWLRARPEVDAARVLTLSDLADLRARELRPAALRSAPPDERATTATSLFAHRAYRGLLLSADRRATLVLAPFALAAPDQRAAMLDALAAPLDALRSALPTGSEVHPVGVPLVQATYASVALRDIVLLVPITILVIALFLGLAFRRAYAIIGPLSGVGLATIWTLGLIQALGLPFDMVNSVAGVAILVVGVAEGAHIVARHREELARLLAEGHPAPHHEAILETMARMVPACFVTSATTAVGFGSLASAELPAIRNFGLVLAAGVMMAWFIQMALMPIVLSFVSERPDARPEPLDEGNFTRFLDRVATLVIASPAKWALLGLATAIAGALGALNLRADARAAGELTPDHPVARGLAAMEESLAGVLVHSIVIRGREQGLCASDSDCPAGRRCRRVDPYFHALGRLRDGVAALTGHPDDALLTDLEAALHREDGSLFAETAPPTDGTCAVSVTTPAVFALIRELTAWLHAQRDAALAAGRPALISHVQSLDDLLADLGASAPATAPAALAERVGVLESGAPDAVARLLTPDHARTQVVLRANDVGLAAWRDFEPRLRAELDALIARHGLTEHDVVISGGSTLAERAISGVARDLVDSVAYDVLLILAFIVGLVRSVRLALLAMLPNLWPLIVTLGLMGALDIPIRASTIIVFSVALGIAVDDTTHFVHRYREEVLRSGEGTEAIRRTLLATGRPIVLTSLILVCGFMVNALSDFMAILEFGVLSAVTLGLALVVELFLTPALLLLAQGRLGRAWLGLPPR